MKGPARGHAWAGGGGSWAGGADGRFAVFAGDAGVLGVDFPAAGPAAAGSARHRHDGGMAGAIATRAAEEIAAYLAGELRDFDVPVDLGPIEGFRRAVLEAAREIPFGQTASYREMAIAAGSPGAVRAAGTAMGANPVPLLIPCHRVIRSDGSPGLYAGGEDLKRRLLAFEAAGNR